MDRQSELYSRQQASPPEDAPPQQAATTLLPHDPWVIHQRYRIGFWLLLVLAVALGMLAALLFRQNQRLLRARAVSALPVAVEAPPEPEPLPHRTEDQRAVRLGFFADQTPDFQIDELLDVAPEEIPEGGDLPLDANWVKQAGHYLISGERAYRKGHYPLALEHLNNALLIYPDLRGVRRYVGLIHLISRQYEAAIPHFEQALREEPDDVRLLNNLGVCQMFVERFDQAQALFEKAGEVRPHYSLSHFNLAKLHYEQRRFDQALVCVEQHITLRPEHFDATQLKAQILIKLERWADASSQLQLLAREAPDVAPIFFRLAQTLARSEQKDDAMDALRKGITLVDSHRALAWINTAEFDSLRDHEEFQKLVMDLSRARTL